MRKQINAILLCFPDRKQCTLFEGQRGIFPCQHLKKSETKPKSVHKLKPGDIDVVAAIGDSITSGMGALGENIGHAMNEYRGVSFSIGITKILLRLK